MIRRDPQPCPVFGTARRSSSGNLHVLTQPPPISPSLLAGTARALREATLDVHRRAEDEPFIAELMSGRLGTADFARLTGQLRPIYAALEQAVGDMRSRGLLTDLLDPRLDRLAAIDRDLATLANGDAAPLTIPLPSTQAYVARVRRIAGSEPRLLAHHYVRYLGDLSGGQIIAALMRRHYQLADDALTFYAFDGIDSKGGFKATYRRRLDQMLADPAFYADMLDETRRAYEANRRVFAQLGSRH